MLLFAILAVLLPWSIYRQMHEHRVARETLVKLPLIFIGVGLLFGGGGHVHGPAATAAMLGGIAVSVLFGVARGAAMPVWQDAEGHWMTRGNRLTLTRWSPSSSRSAGSAPSPAGSRPRRPLRSSSCSACPLPSRTRSSPGARSPTAARRRSLPPEPGRTTSSGTRARHLAVAGTSVCRFGRLRRSRILR
jgi:hypothetical protein